MKKTRSELFRQWPTETRCVLGTLWTIWVRWMCPNKTARRAALARLARLTDPNAQDIARAIKPKE